MLWAAFALGVLLSLNAAVQAVANGTGDSKIDREDPNGVCQWEDEAGMAKCKEQEHRRNKDPYLPNASGGRDYFDDDHVDRKVEEEEKEEDGNNEEEEEQNEDWDGGDSRYSNDDYWDTYDYYKPNPEEDGEEWDVWKHGSKTEIYEHLECPDFDYSNDEMFKDSSFENIHTTETWKTFNKVYNQVIADMKGDEELEQDSTIPPEFEKHGFQFPIEIQFKPIIGRGVYATTHIPKGSLLYISTNNAAFFTGQAYRNFLRALPPKLACDVLIWAFVRWVSLDSSDNEEHMVCVDLDEGSFVNSADDEPEAEHMYNMALGNDDGVMYYDLKDQDDKEQLWFGCKMKFYAARDIEPGEEIRASYGDFVELNGWMYLGLQ